MKRFIIFLLLLFCLVAFTTPLIALDRGGGFIFERVAPDPPLDQMYVATGATIQLNIFKVESKPIVQMCENHGMSYFCPDFHGFSFITDNYTGRE